MPCKVVELTDNNKQLWNSKTNDIIVIPTYEVRTYQNSKFIIANKKTLQQFIYSWWNWVSLPEKIYICDEVIDLKWIMDKDL